MQSTRSHFPGAKRPWLFLIGGGLFLPLVVGFIGYFGFIHPLKSYISPVPWPIEHLEVSRLAQENIVLKIKTFSDSGKSGDSLILNSEDLNHLIRSNAMVQSYNVKYLIELGDSLFNLKCNPDVNTVRIQLSWLIRLLGLKGYINAEIEGYVRFRENKLKIITTRSQMAGRQAPFTLLGKRTHIDIENFFADRAYYLSFITFLRSVKINNQRLVFVRK